MPKLQDFIGKLRMSVIEGRRFIHDPVAVNAAGRAGHPAIYDRERVVTYEELWGSILTLGSRLEERSPRGARIGIILNNSTEMVKALYAVSLAGMISVPLDTDMHAKNLSYILQDCGVRLILTAKKFLPTLSRLNLQRQYDLLPLDGPDSVWHGPADGKGDLQPVPSPDTASILYTTGSTGPRKGVMLSHSQLLSATENINRFMQIDADTVESLPMRLSHSFGFARLRCVFDVGGSVIVENGFLRPERILFNMEAKKANAVSSVPSGFALLLEFFPDDFRKIAPRLRHVEIGSDFMRMKQKKKLMGLCPDARICMHYGLTEASRATFLDFFRDRAHLDSVGKPSPNVEIRIGDEKGNAAEVNVPGEILVKGDMVMSGYWGNPKMTRETIKRGWLHTGDTGCTDSEGYVYLLGRNQEIINVGGLKVSPLEIEEILLRYGGIKEARVVGEESEGTIFQSRIKAFLVVDDKRRFKNFENLFKYCAQEMEAYKVPAEFEILPEIQRSKKREILWPSSRKRGR